MQKAQLISPEETLDLRQRILRPGQDLSLCKYAEDNLPSTFHLGIRESSEPGARIISNGTFIQQPHELFAEAKHPYRLRGMATEPKFQRQGFGRLIIDSALVELRQRKCDLLWFNARTSAEIFYRRLGFLADENIFEIALIGPHKVMYKWL